MIKKIYSNSYSLSEIEALSKKSSKGAGLFWGHAEEVGKDIRWLSAYQLNGAGILATYLNSQSFNVSCANDIINKSGIWSAKNKMICPIIGGTLIADRIHMINGNTIIQFARTAWPILLIAQLGRAAEDLKKSFIIEWAGFFIILSDEGIYYEGVNLYCSQTESIIFTECNKTNVKYIKHKTFSVSVKLKDWEILLNLAHKTYAPETDSSKLYGAGAGLTDND